MQKNAWEEKNYFVMTSIIHATIAYANQIITIQAKTEIIVVFDFVTSSSFPAEVRILNHA